MAKKRVFSGIQPSGDMHIGNYLGAILNWVRMQDDRDNIFCIVDEHAITVPQDPEDLRRRILELAKIYLAAGIDPEKSAVFVQSSRPEHAELGWILNNYTYFGELSRMTQFKDKSKNKGENVTVGLFDYPVLMAADILLYQTDEVPVGDDQKQHVEICRDIAERFNKRYGEEVLRIPEFTTNKAATRIMSLTDPTTKMAKSDPNPKSRIEMLDAPDVIRKKFASAVTDSDNEIKFDEKNKSGISNLLNILSACTEVSIKDLEKKYQGVSYGEFKKDVAEAVIELLSPFQEKYHALSDEKVIEILKEGAERVAPKAKETLRKVKEVIGLGI
jgi:tryptophanyl-tRNA synthetase